jgi:hypothetical protein
MRRRVQTDPCPRSDEPRDHTSLERRDQARLLISVTCLKIFHYVVSRAIRKVTMRSVIERTRTDRDS